MSRSYPHPTDIPISRGRPVSPGDHNFHDIFRIVVVCRDTPRTYFPTCSVITERPLCSASPPPSRSSFPTYPWTRPARTCNSIRVRFASRRKVMQSRLKLIWAQTPRLRYRKYNNFEEGAAPENACLPSALRQIDKFVEINNLATNRAARDK